MKNRKSLTFLFCILFTPVIVATAQAAEKDDTPLCAIELLLNSNISPDPDNLPPGQPNTPNPSDGANSQNLESSLSWNCLDPNGDHITYDILLEAGNAAPATMVSQDQSGTTFSLGTLTAFTTYSWQIIAKDEHGETTTGPVWSFTTGKAGSAIVVDHRHTDISKIPDQWIDAARQYVIHFAHTSHGSQILSGLNWLATQDDRYRVDIEASGSVTQPDDTSALRIYDGNNYSGNTYITPDMYWESDSGLEHTRSTVNTGYFAYSLWTWCGQMSTYSTSQVEEYLDTLAALDASYPGTGFIYFTGHTDGNGTDSTLWHNNDKVRNYVENNDAILFDFADIEAYEPDGQFHSDASDACSWCDGYCTANPTAFSCGYTGSCAHSDSLQCALKGQAFWYLMARLAGWDGTTN